MEWRGAASGRRSGWGYVIGMDLAPFGSQLPEFVKHFREQNHRAVGKDLWRSSSILLKLVP